MDKILTDPEDLHMPKQTDNAKSTKKPRSLCASLSWLLPVALPALLLGLFYAFRGNPSAMDWVILHITVPYKQTISALVDRVPFSVGEVFFLALVLLAVVYVLRTVYLLIRRPGRLPRLLRRTAVGVGAALLVYCGFTLFWGINYYGTSFCDQAGLTRRGATSTELYSLSLAFADKLNELADSVARDADGLFCETTESIFAQSAGLYAGITEEYPFLEAEDRTPKALLSSRLLSYMGFTGFYFPFTGEANLNVDAPACLLPATVAHELSHQRGVTDEDEANFVAILACLRSGNPVYQYSGCLLAYIHLTNALYKVDTTLYAQVRTTLDAAVLADLAANNSYWSALNSTTAGKTAQKAADSAYSSFTASYGEEDVMARYEACVELLVAYYFDS